MNQKDNFDNDGGAKRLADLPLTNEQAEATKAGGVVRNTQVQELNTISENINRSGTQYQQAADDAASSLGSSMGF